MAVIRSIKRYFSHTPGWVIGGLIVVTILWLAVLPIEIQEAIARHDFVRPSSSVWLIRSLYFFGYSSSLALISPWTNSQLGLDNLRLIVVVLGLLIVSPVYFAAGALLSIRKVITITLGILMLTITVMISFLVTVATVFMAD